MCRPHVLGPACHSHQLPPPPHQLTLHPLHPTHQLPQPPHSPHHVHPLLLTPVSIRPIFTPTPSPYPPSPHLSSHAPLTPLPSTRSPQPHHSHSNPHLHRTPHPTLVFPSPHPYPYPSPIATWPPAPTPKFEIARDQVDLQILPPPHTHPNLTNASDLTNYHPRNPTWGNRPC